MQRGIPQAAAPISEDGVRFCQELPLISNPTNHTFSLQPAQSYQMAKIIYTGKIKEGMNDDIAMTVLFSTYWAQQFLNKKIQVPYHSFI